MIDGLAAEGAGIFRVVTRPAFGRQHLGHAPGGPQDRAAARAATGALGLPPGSPVLEVVAAPALRFTADARFVLTGAPRAGARIGDRPAAHAAVQRAAAGETLRLGGAAAGLRTYLALAPDAGGPLLTLPPLSARRPPAPPGVLRLLPGPEWGSLDDPGLLLDRPWRVTPDHSDAGLRLSPVGSLPAPRCRPPEVTSASLADGCVQLTPSGPVVFLRGRPTLGGYPRVGCLTEAGVDHAAQLRAGDRVRFTAAAVGGGASGEERK